MKKIIATLLACGCVMNSLWVLGAEISFEDIENHWAEESINKWVENGVINGYNGNFRPNEKITRGEVAVILQRVMGYQNEAENTFKDLDESFYESAMLKVNQAKIMIGANESLRPNDNVTREEMAVMLTRAMHFEAKESDETSFLDSEKISSWAKESVAILVEKGILQGGTQGNFEPQEAITRAEVVTMLDRAVSEFITKNETFASEIDGNVVINAENITLSNCVITGDLIIAEGVQNGEIVLENVTILGNVVIKGGSEITVENVKIQGELVIEKEFEEVVVLITCDSEIMEVKAIGNAVISLDYSAKVDKITVVEETNINGLSFDHMEVEMEELVFENEVTEVPEETEELTRPQIVVGTTSNASKDEVLEDPKEEQEPENDTPEEDPKEEQEQENDALEEDSQEEQEPENDTPEEDALEEDSQEEQEPENDALEEDSQEEQEEQEPEIELAETAKINDTALCELVSDGTQANRVTTKTINFVQTKVAPENAVDVSAQSDKSVMMWAENNAENNELFDVYIEFNAKKLVLPSDVENYFMFLEFNIDDETWETNLTKINGLEYLDTSFVTKMDYMFQGIQKVESIDVSSFDTANVDSMLQMFQECKSLKTLDLSNFDTSKVTTMGEMFSGCESLTELDVTGFDTSNVTFMVSMFADCSSLTKLDLSKFDTSKTTNMSGMFSGCKSLTELGVTSFDTSGVKYMGSMFAECSSLSKLDLCKFDMSSVTYLSDIFKETTNLTTVYVKSESDIVKFQSASDESSIEFIIK